MQISDVEDRPRKMVLGTLAAEGALQDVAEPQASDWRGVATGIERNDSALSGLRLAMPIALLLWAVIAGLIWVVVR